MPSLLGVRNICICRLCRIHAHYLSCTKKKKCAISLHIVLKSRCAVSLHQVCILRVFTKSLHSLHKVCICFHKLITKCALSVPDADFADLVQTLQTWCNKTPVRPVLARPPYKHHRPDCTQALQTSRPCPKSPDSKRTLHSRQ